jgi:hypothetical protein
MNKRSLLICALACIILSAVCLIVALLGASSAADGKFDQKLGLTSPNGKIRFQCELNVDNIPSLNVYYMTGNEWDKIISMPNFGLTEGTDAFLSYKNASKTIDVNDDYMMLSGKRLHCVNQATERTFSFVDRNNRTQNLIVRAYNDGVAFRFALAKGYKECNFLQEQTTYHFSDSAKRWLQRFDDSYEKFYWPNPKEREGCHWGYPSLFEPKDSLYILITEADMTGENSGSGLRSTAASGYKIQNGENRLALSDGWQTPWRVAIIGSLADVVESTLVTDVSAPCKISDTEWIKPGVASWIYWAYNHGSSDYQIVKQYIDMAAELKLPYTLIDAEWDEMHGGNIYEAIAYAKQKGVKLLMWYNSTTKWVDRAPGPKYRLNKAEDREKEFKWLEDNGIAGVKIDFFEGDKQRTNQYCIELLESAAKHHLLVNFHGATLPRGWQRTYPNLLSTEAVMGAEWYNNAPFLTERAAPHNATLPFTRGVVGSMDYTPCTFTDSQFPHITTHAHELALTVLYESALLHLADRPSSYLSQPADVQRFFTNLPTVWDDTKLVCGYPGEYVVMARERNSKWYVAGINGSDGEREIAVNLDFIKSGKFKMFADSGNADSPWTITNLDANNLPESVKCLPRGGFVIVGQ